MEHRVLIVAGDDAENRINEFSATVEVPPYIVYKYEDADKLRDIRIQQLKEMQKSPEKFGVTKEFIDLEIEDIEDQTGEEYFTELTWFNEHDEDGNAISRLNPEGKFIKCYPGGAFSQPFLLKDGTTAYKAKKSDIDWSEIHMNHEYVNLYERTWEMCVEGLEPVSDMDKQVYENMKNRQDYFDNFKDKQEYVTSCSSFWAFAFLNPLDIWVDADDCPVTQFEWMSTYYDRFIKPLPEDTILTIFEYVTN